MSTQTTDEATAEVLELPLGDIGAVGFPQRVHGQAMEDRGTTREIRGRAYRMRRVLALTDAIAIAAALLVCAQLDALTRFDTVPDSGWLVYLPLFVLSWLGLAGIAGLYHLDEGRIECSVADEMFRVLQLVAVWIWSVFLVAALAGDGSPAVAPALALGIVATPVILAARAAARRLARTRDWYRESAIVLGGAADRERVERTLDRHPEFGVDVVASFELDPASPRSLNGGLAHLLSTIFDRKVHRVILASSQAGLDERSGLLRHLGELGIKVDIVPGDKEVFRSDAHIHHIEGLPLLTLPGTKRPRSTETIKRALDIAVSGFALALFAPAMIVIAVAIKLDSRGPVFFRQERVGRGGRHFRVMKFRTMVCDADEIKHTVDALNTRTDGMFKIERDPRITRVGRFLRRHSLDELPQLFNVLKGEMSLVGPRPLIESESKRVSEPYDARFEVRPGITGLWQVLGRSDIPFDEMLKLDYTYVANWSIAHDAKLMVRTLSAIGGGRGAY